MSKPFPVNIHRFDPYKNYRFLVYFDRPTPVAGVSKVSGLRRKSEVIEYREGGNPLVTKGIGRTTYEPLTLERGVTQDVDFETWANVAQVLDNGMPTAPPGVLRKTIGIELLNEGGVPVQRYFVFRCWVSEYQALGDLDASGNAIVLQHVRIENEGWERDMTLAEPAEGPQ